MEFRRIVIGTCDHFEGFSDEFLFVVKPCKKRCADFSVIKQGLILDCVQYLSEGV